MSPHRYLLERHNHNLVEGPKVGSLSEQLLSPDSTIQYAEDDSGSGEPIDSWRVGAENNFLAQPQKSWTCPLSSDAATDLSDYNDDQDND